VAIILNLREPEVTKLFREYLKLQGSHKLNLVYEEIGEDNIEDFVEFYNSVKERGMGRMHMVKALAIADKELPYLEEKCELLKVENNDLESKKQQSNNELHTLNDKIASSKELLKSYTSSCERKRQESESLNNEISRLETLVTRFKSNNEEYLKIKQTTEEKVKSVLIEGKTLVQVAIILNLREPEITKLYKEYCKLNRRDILNLIDKETNGKLGIFLKLYKQLIKKKGMTIEQVGNIVEIAIHKLPHMESLYKQLKDEVDKLQYIRQGLLNDIAALKYKILILDKTAFSIEQDSKRKEQ
jgi:chromosome segregation ATPase